MFDLPEWWSRTGLPGMRSDEGPVTGAPWTWAGHVRGAWQLIEPTRAPLDAPFPGVMLAPTPIVFYDSVAAGVQPADGRSLRTGHGFGAPGSERRAHSVIALRNGSFGLDESALGFQRGDSAMWVRAETSSSQRGGIGGWDGLSRHVWGAAGGFAAGAHRLGVHYAQRGGAARLAGGEEQSSSGESGGIRWRWQGERAAGGLTLARGHDFHESLNELFVYSRRDAQQNRATLEGEVRGAHTRTTAAIEVREGRIDRAFDRAARARGVEVWSTLGHTRPAAGGVLTLTLGAGQRPRAGGFHVAPAADWRAGEGAFTSRVFVARITESIWADLAPGQTPFLQNTWTGGLELGASSVRRRRERAAVVSFQFGQTADRAVVLRRPVDDLWLRAGFRADPERYTFGVLALEGRLAGGPLEADARGFGLFADRNAIQGRVDPAAGFRARLGTRFDAFTGDLGVRIAVLAEGVGPRDSEADPGRRLPGYVSAGLSGIFTLADVVVTVELLNLEDRRREQVWLDHATGIGALGPGRAMRLMLTWRLFG